MKKNSSKSAETSFYAPPQSPIAIQPGDTGFVTVGKQYNRFIWTFGDWKNQKKRIINPDTNWYLDSKPITQKEWEKKQKDLFLK
jgi:hypothetical protein